MARKHAARSPRTRRPPSRWVESLKARLERQRDGLRAEIDQETSRLGVAGGSRASEDGDLAEDEREDEETAQTVETLETRFQEVHEALRRIQRGTYGVCADCRSPISLARLRALPAATRCTFCQKTFEQAARG